MPEQERPDWILNSIAGKTNNIEALYIKGTKVGDFDIKEKDDYWNLDGVKNMFKTSDGKDDFQSFSTMYDTERERFLKTRQAEYDASNFKADFLSNSLERMGVISPHPAVKRTNPDMWGRTYGFDYNNGSGFSEKQRGWRESAIKTGVKTEGGYVDTKNFDGLTKFAVEKDGSIATDENGSPYMKPVEDGEQLKSFEQVYNPHAEWWGYYGHDYEAKHIAGSFIKNAVGFFAQTADSIAEFPKAILAFTDEGENSAAYKKIVNFENWTKQYKPSLTEEGQENFFSLESLTDLGQQVVWQLGAMVITGGTVSGVAKMLGAGAKVAGKAGSVGGRLLMTGMAAGPIAEISRDNNLTGKESALLLGLTSALIYPLMAIEEFVAYDKIMGTANKAIRQQIAKDAQILVRDGMRPSSFRAFASTLPANIKNILYNVSKGPAIIKGVVGESVEESAEQVIDLGVRSLYSLYNNNINEDSWIAKQLGTKKGDNFQFNWVDEVKALGHAAVGGAIGGGIAGPLMRRINKSKPELGYALEEMIVDGKENVLYNYIRDMEAQERLDYNFKDTDGEYTKESSKSRNAEAASILRGTVDYIVKLRDDQQLDKLYANNEAKAASLVENIKFSSVGKDAGKLFSQINELEGKIAGMQTSDADLNQTDLEELMALRDQKQETLNNIKRGKFVADYAAEGIYNLNSIARENPEWDRTKLSGKNFVNLSKTSPTFVEAANEKISDANKQLEDASNTATVEKYNRVTREGKDRILTDAENQYISAIEALKPHAEAVSTAITDANLEFPVEMDNLLDPNKRSLDIFSLEQLSESEKIDEHLSPLVANLLEANSRIEAIKKFEPAEITQEMKETDLMLNMIDSSDENAVRNTSIPIEKKIADEMALEVEMVSNGISLYSNPAQIEDIKKSIEARIAQVHANPIVTDQVNELYKANEQTPIKKITPEEQTEFLSKLRSMHADITALEKISNENANSQENKIRETTLNKFKLNFAKLATLQSHYAGTQYKEISDIISNYNIVLAESIERGSIEDYFATQREMENALYEYGKDNRGLILNTFEFGSPTASAIRSGEFDDQLRAYEYIRGVLAESSNNIWNAVREVVTESSGIMAASDEQLISIVSALQGLAAQKYNTFEIEKFAMASHHNTYMVNGGGGSGKTSLIAPIISGAYQKLYGGKVYLTSYQYLGYASKRENLYNAFVNYHQDPETKGLHIDLTRSGKNIRDFISDATEANETNLIIYDEVTLLGTEQLEVIQEELDKVNVRRQEANEPLLKILFLGDLNQNSPSQGAVDTNTIQGIGDTVHHQMAKSDPLTFSFREQNQQVRMFNDWTKQIQSEVGKSDPITTTYKGFEGVQIITDQNKFDNKVANIIAKLKSKKDPTTKKDNLFKAVYITDKSKAVLPDSITMSGIKILTSEESQGEEWDYVFYDPNNKEIFGKRSNIIPKKQLHTASTRTGKMFIASLNESTGLKSKEGAIYNVKPISPSKTTKDVQIEKFTNILGDAIGEVNSNKIYDPIQEKPVEATLTETTFIERGVPGQIDPSATITTNGALAEYIRTRNNKDEVSLHSFFTLEGQDALKNRAIYDQIFSREGRQEHSYMITVAKIGTPEYTNVINNDPSFDGTYAILIEAVVDNQKVVLGTLSLGLSRDSKVNSAEFEKFINDNNIMQGKETMSIALENDFLYKSKNFQPTVKFDTTGRSRPLSELVNEYGEHMTFGQPRVLTQDMLSTAKGRGTTATAGEIVIPISVAYTNKDQINKALFNSPREEHVSLIPVNKVKVDVNTMYNELVKFLSPDGKFIFRDGSAGLQYETFFKHHIQDVISSKRIEGEDQKSTVSIGKLAKTINNIFKTIPDTDAEYRNFVAGYTKIDQSEGDKNIAVILNDKMAEVGQIKRRATNRNEYLFANYMEARFNNQTKKVSLFNRLFDDIQKADTFYKDGFEFNPRAGENTGEGNNVNRPTAEGEDMNRLYQTYLRTDMESITPPSIRISKEDLMKSLQKGISVVSPEVSQSTEVDGITTNTNPDATGEGDNYTDPNISTTDPKISTLLDFQRNYFKGALINSLGESISRFKRKFYDNFFNLNTGTIVPVDEAVSNFKADLEAAAQVYPEEGIERLRIIENQGDRSNYIDWVLNKNFDFLMNKYAPTVQKLPDSEVYQYVSSHIKNRSFNDKESFSLLQEGMTEMVKTQINNTPLVRQTTKDEYKTVPEQYLSPEKNTEEIVDAFNTARDNSRFNGTQSIVDILRNSKSDVLQSIYVRFYAPSTTKIDGIDKFSLSGFDNIDVKSMVDAISIFFSSGEVFNLSAVDLNSKENKVPLSTIWDKPLLIRETGQNVMIDIASRVSNGEIIASRTEGGYTIGGRLFNTGSDQIYQTQDVLDGFESIGMTFVDEEHLDNMMIFSAGEMQLQGEETERIQRRNEYLMRRMIFPALNNIIENKIAFIQSSELVYRAVARTDGLNIAMNSINLNGDKVYRLRNTSPIFSITKKLNESQGDPRFEKNLLNSRYKIDKFYLKDGFKQTLKGKKNNKSNNSLMWEETVEYDLIWNFAYVLNKSGGTTMGMPLMVYSDGSSDITPLVKIRGGQSAFDTGKIAKELFDSRVQYYTEMEKSILNKWNNLLSTDFSTLITLDRHLQKSTKNPTGVKGMIKNIDYMMTKDAKGNTKTVINPILIKDVARYKSSKFDKFKAHLDGNYKIFAHEVAAMDSKGVIKAQLKETINRDPDDVIKAFYYNWVAISSEATNITMGDSSQYRGATKSEQYVDFVKRAKAQMSNHTIQIFRNPGWENIRKGLLESGQELTPTFIQEGMKLSRNYKVAYTNDPEITLYSLAGERKPQEIYDGATFVTPLTRIFQRASNGGDHGTNVSHVMKNITTSAINGVTTFIKNAEFELTPEMMRNGTERVQKMVQNMMSPAFDEVLSVDDITVESAWDYLTKVLNVSEDLSNIDYTHFAKLADFLVYNGLQGVPVLELLPMTSVKTGGGAINSIDSDEGFVTETIDIYNKGTQLDATKDAKKGLNTTAPSQLFNALGLNWREPEATLEVHNALAALATDVTEQYEGLTAEELDSELKNMVRAANDGSEGITYQHKLIETDYSIDDRQILNRTISLLNANLAGRGISTQFTGGQHIVHPANGLVQIYEDSKGNTYTKVNAPEGAVARELSWEPPKRTSDNKLLTKTDEYLIMLAMRGTEQFNESQRIVDEMLQTGEWEGGFAEIMLSTEMQLSFGLRSGMTIEEVTEDFFREEIISKRKESGKPDYAKGTVDTKAKMMYNGFQKRLTGIAIRIPTTGKHSAVTTKIVAFMDGSDNSLFVPADLLMIQGADQDIDKGSYLTYTSVDGIIPEVDENYQLLPKYKRKGILSPSQFENARIAGIKNRIVENIQKILQSSKNTIESNLSVDEAMTKLKQLRDEAQRGESFDRDDYISYARMHDINQSGKALVALFANAQKAYEVMYDAFKANGFNDNSILSGLDTASPNETWIKLAGLINAATDNAKEQILGTLGIGIHNANMVSYLITKGFSFEQVIDFINSEKNAPYMKILRDSQRYDSPNKFFKPEVSWSERPDLINVYNKAQEFSTLAITLGVNTDLPNSAYEMYVYKRRIEDFVNDSYKKVGINAKFNFNSFIERDDYANQHINLYKTLRNSTEDHDFNILYVLKNSIPIRAYSKVYNTAYNIVNGQSAVTRISNSIADSALRIGEDRYKDIVDFTYGIAVSEFMQNTKEINNRFDLGTIEGRNQFVQYMGDNQKGFLSYLKSKSVYNNNSFVQKNLFVEQVEKFKYDIAPQLRTHDMMFMDEQALLTLQAGFEMLEDVDKHTLVNYMLITRKNAMGRGSIAQLFDPENTKEFNTFLKTFDTNVNNALKGKYRTYQGNSNNTTNFHNSIPYSLRENSPKGQRSAGVKVVNPRQAYVLNRILRNLNAGRKGAALFMPIPNNLSLSAEKVFIEGGDPITVINLIDMGLQSKRITKADRESLERIKGSLIKEPVSNKKSNDKKKNCE